MARRTKDEAEQTRNAILDAAEKIFYQRGVVRTSLEQIAKAAHVTRGAVYWHFKDKMEVCEAMVDRVFLPQEDMLEQLAARKTSTPLEDLEKACLHSLRLMATDKRRQRVFSILMFRCEYVEDMERIMERRRECKDRMFDRTMNLFERAFKLGQMSPQWPPRMAAIALHAMMSGLIISALEGRKGFDLLNAGSSALEVFFQSLQSEKLASARKVVPLKTRKRA